MKRRKSTKYILVIPDGMGDKPVKVLGNKTPLEAARTPHMDFFAGRGRVGLVQNIPHGFVPGTDIGSMSLFGYDPQKYFTGRGPLEAAELGIHLKKDEIAFRCNLVTTDGDILKDFSADHISTEEASKLLSTLNRWVQKQKIRAKFYPGKGTGYRNLMILKGREAHLAKIKCTPPHDIMGQPYKKFLPQGKSSEILVDLMMGSRPIFESHPVNQKRARRDKGLGSMVWLWGQGFPPVLPSYRDRFGMKGGVITAVDLLKGIARHAGLDVIRVPGVTGYFDTNYVGKAEYALKSLRNNDFVAIHVESTDEAGHRGDAGLKVKAIEAVDRLVLGTLRKGLHAFRAYKILLLPDHFTCVETRTHSSDPVPFFMYSNQDEKKGPKKFCERTAAQSGTFLKAGHDLMDLFVKGKNF